MNTDAIAIVGAGNVGCYLGGRLAAAGAPITLVARPRICALLAQYGLRVSDLYGSDKRLEASALTISSDAAAIANARFVLITVKSVGTETAAAQIAAHLSPDAIVISLQNGLHNTAQLKQSLPHHSVLAGMVPYNVVHRGEGHFHQSSSGALFVDAHQNLHPLLDVIHRAALPVETLADMPSVQWAKLLLRLNNAINALSGLPLKEKLSQRGFRRCLALAQREGLHLMQHAGIRPARLTALPTRWMTVALSAPDGLFRRLGQKRCWPSAPWHAHRGGKKSIRIPGGHASAIPAP